MSRDMSRDIERATTENEPGADSDKKQEPAIDINIEPWTV
jgi:hypothetical protein